jgi:hypothetical protein
MSALFIFICKDEKHSGITTRQHRQDFINIILIGGKQNG